MILCLHSSRFLVQKRKEKRLISIGFLKDGRIILIKERFSSNPFKTCVLGKNSQNELSRHVSESHVYGHDIKCVGQYGKTLL